MKISQNKKQINNKIYKHKQEGKQENREKENKREKLYDG